MDTMEVYLQIWKQLRSHIENGGDVIEAADDFVHVLLEHGIDVKDIIGYSIDPELKSVVKDYLDDSTPEFQNFVDGFELNDDWVDDEDLDIGC